MTHTAGGLARLAGNGGCHIYNPTSKNVTVLPLNGAAAARVLVLVVVACGALGGGARAVTMSSAPVMTMENFELLTENVYVHRKKKKLEWDDVQECGCKVEEDGTCCGSDGCLNRASFVECHPEHCKGGDKCKNQRLLRHQYAKVERVKVGPSILFWFSAVIIGTDAPCWQPDPRQRVRPRGPTRHCTGRTCARVPWRAVKRGAVPATPCRV